MCDFYFWVNKFLKKKNMKKKFNLTKCLACLCSITIIALVASCKQEEIRPSEITLSKDVKIEMLKVYLSDLSGVDTAKISYNATKNFFLIDDVEQMSKEKLEELYTNNPILHYKNGVAVSRN